MMRSEPETRTLTRLLTINPLEQATGKWLHAIVVYALQYQPIGAAAFGGLTGKWKR